MTLQIKTGEVYNLKLPSNLSTGYTWSFAPKESPIITINEVSDGLPSDTPGAPGETIFRIKGMQKGNAKITFTYRRVWEKDIAPKETKRITVKVK